MPKFIRSIVLTAAIAFTAGTSTFAADSKMCIVTGDTFGGDKGPPVSVTYKGRTIMLCCKSCVRKFNANPEKYLGAAGAAVAAK